MNVGYCEKENREPGGNLLLLMGRADWRVNVSKLEQKGTEKLFAAEEKSYEERKLVGI